MYQHLSIRAEFKMFPTLVLGAMHTQGDPKPGGGLVYRRYQRCLRPRDLRQDSMLPLLWVTVSSRWLPFDETLFFGHTVSSVRRGKGYVYIFTQ